MKKLAMLFLLAVLPVGAQTIPATANLTASDSGACTTAGACLTVNVPNQVAASVIQLTGTFSATLQFEGTTSVGGTFVSVAATPLGGGSQVTSATATGSWRVTASGLAQLRVRCSTFSSGPAVAAITLSSGSSGSGAAASGSGVTSVTGTAPIVSSGGTTPAISCPTCNTSASNVTSVFTRTGAVTAQSGDYTLDQIGSPAASKTFALGANNFGTSATGVFTSGQMNQQNLTTLSGGGTCSPSTVINAWNSTSFALTDGIASCVNVPTSGVTNAFSNALAGYALSDNGNSTGQNGWVGAVGVYGQTYVTASSARGWGMNAGCVTATSLTGAHCIGDEIDVGLNNNTDVGFGMVISIAGGAGQPTADNFPAVYLQSPSGGKFTSGFECASAAIASTNTYPCLVLNTQTTANPSSSQQINFNARQSGGTSVTGGIGFLASSVGDTTDGQFGFGQSPIQVTSVVSVGTQSISGCSLTSGVGGPWAGSFHSGTTGTCTVTITMKTAANGFACAAQDMTTTTDIIHQTAYTTTTATISGTTASGDVITYHCFSF